MFKLHNVIPFGDDPDTMHCEVVIIQDEPYRMITVRLKGDVRTDSELVVVNKALEQLYQEIYPNRAESEAIAAVNTTVSSFIAETQRTIQETLKAVVHIDALDEEQLDQLYNRFPEYSTGAYYEPGDIFKYENTLYEVIQQHVSQSHWRPPDTPALYTVYKNINVGDVEIITDFIQPAGAHDAYGLGDKVNFNGKVYESVIGANVWSPADNPQGWKEII